ncbi:MAG: hypothetical protein L0154_24655 [Chloroflexi bacterium]|nr:hypothetical protein [Chloroflexota bacterium]
MAANFLDMQQFEQFVREQTGSLNDNRGVGKKRTVGDALLKGNIRDLPLVVVVHLYPQFILARQQMSQRQNVYIKVQSTCLPGAGWGMAFHWIIIILANQHTVLIKQENRYGTLYVKLKSNVSIPLKRLNINAKACVQDAFE